MQNLKRPSSMHHFKLGNHNKLLNVHLHTVSGEKSGMQQSQLRPGLGIRPLGGEVAQKTVGCSSISQSAPIYSRCCSSTPCSAATGKRRSGAAGDSNDLIWSTVSLYCLKYCPLRSDCLTCYPLP